MGWLVRVPANWRPLDIEGDWKRGRMMVGDSESAIFQISWRRPRWKRFKPERWVRRALKRSVVKESDPQSGPSSPDARCIAWIPGEMGQGFGKTVWYGYSEKVRLLLEIVVGGPVEMKQRRPVAKKVIPSLEVFGPGDPTQWIVFDVGFELPPGFRCTERKLGLGDMALRFDTRGGKRLVVRQVYPAELALSRRKIERWLVNRPFKEQRRFRKLEDPRPWTVDSFGRTLEGMIVRGRKRLAFPFGRIRPRFSSAAAVRDPDLDRILMVEYDQPADDGEALIRRLLGRMNRPALEKGESV
jgi:hypothetical protein